MTRGVRMVELLKQPQYQPMPFEEQIISFFIGLNGFLDASPVREVTGIVRNFVAYVRNSHPDMLTEVVELQKLTDEWQEKMKKICAEFIATLEVSE